jgi:hypothetical protein
MAKLPLEEKPNVDSQLRLLQGVQNNRPDIIAEWQGNETRNEIKRRMRATFGQADGDELRRRGLTLITYGKKTEECLGIFGKKLLRALYFKHVGRSLDGPVYCHYGSVLENREAIEIACRYAPNFHQTQRNNVSLSEQFFYRYQMLPGEGVFFAVAQMGDQLSYFGHAFSKAFYEQEMIRDPVGMKTLQSFYERSLGKTSQPTERIV